MLRNVEKDVRILRSTASQFKPLYRAFGYNSKGYFSETKNKRQNKGKLCSVEQKSRRFSCAIPSRDNFFFRTQHLHVSHYSCPCKRSIAVSCTFHFTHVSSRVRHLFRVHCCPAALFCLANDRRA